MLKKLVILISCLLFHNTASADDALTQIFSLPRDARWALVTVELKNGKEFVRVGNAVAEPLTPASLVKLFTAGALLDHQERNGSPYLRTALLYDGEIRDGTLHGNISLRGQGNALLSAADLREAAKKIAERGIRKVIGDIIADETFIDAGGLERARKGPGYAPAGALGLDLHTVAVIVSPKGTSQAPILTVEPANNFVRHAIEARTTATGAASVKVIPLDDTSYRIAGKIPEHSGALKWRFALREPALYAAQALETVLAQEGVKIEGIAKKAKTPGGARPLADIDGLPLEKQIREMNVNSLNVVADNLFLVLGAEKYGAPGTREKGVWAMNEFLATLGLPKGETAIGDGSGLSTGNRVMAGFMARYLHAVTKESWFKGFLNSFPSAGMEGTVKDIGYKDGRFRVKSGMLEDAYALAGYGVDARGREVAFAFIVNVPGAASLNLDRCGAEVMKYLGTEVVQ